MFLLGMLTIFIWPLHCLILTRPESNEANGDVVLMKRSSRSIPDLNIMAEQDSSDVVVSQESRSQASSSLASPSLQAEKEVSHNNARNPSGHCVDGRYILPPKFAARQSEFRLVEAELLEVLNSPDLNSFQQRREMALKMLQSYNFKIGAKALVEFLLCHNLGPETTPIVPSGPREDMLKGSSRRYKKGDRKLMAELVVRLHSMTNKTMQEKAEYARAFFEAHGFSEPHNVRVSSLFRRYGMGKSRWNLLEQRQVRFS